ncbi:hypothetical protein CXB51_029944 [Gossypium anomalum]|uniref:DUF4283 domain-containing protein n=1 Tax=Gossypium anomalum TaxID=47600 RepID=A0A8J5YCD4_9ROSI|nr:hypothetical protein CXB51_029944 [Gossypium anomalum]
MKTDSKGDEPILDNDIVEEECIIHITLSKEERKLICSRWRNMLVVKLFGKITWYKYLIFKLRQLQKPKENLKLIDLGYNFLFAKLENDKDYEQVIKGGLWFSGGKFLAMQKRALNFRALEATFNSVAMWVRLPEYCDPKIFTKIVWSLGVPLWTDSFTMSSERGPKLETCTQSSPVVKEQSTTMIENLTSSLATENGTQGTIDDKKITDTRSA